MKKYLILSLLAVALAFSLSTCHDCPEEFPIEDFSDLPNPFRVDSAKFLTLTDGFDGWYIYFNRPVDTSSVKGKINLRVEGEDAVYSGHFEMFTPSLLYISICDFASRLGGQQPTLSYTLELSGDDEQPIRSTTGQRLDGNNDATDGGVFTQKITQAICGDALLITPTNGSSVNLQVQPGKFVDLFINFWGPRMDTGSFELGKTVFVTDGNNNPVPVTLNWNPDWYNLRISTTQPVEQICTGNCQIKVEIRKEVKTAFGKSMADDYFFTTFVN